jgi:hypothetical protein
MPAQGCTDHKPFVMCDLPAGTLVGQAGTRVPFSDSQLSLTFPIEQFWGRAARASWVRKNPDARLILGCAARTLPSTRSGPALSTKRPSAKPKARPTAADKSVRATPAKSICRNGEVHCDARLRFHGLPVLDVGLEVPLLHRLASRGSEDARATQDL